MLRRVKMAVSDTSVLEGDAPVEEESRRGPAPPRERAPASRHVRRAAGAVQRRWKDEPAATPDAAFEQGGDYWDALIDEDVAANFVGVTPRTLQKRRQAGTGPPFIKISERCIRYTRRRLKQWADGYLRRSTSDPGPEEVA
jgi:hypothetical protein